MKAINWNSKHRILLISLLTSLVLLLLVSGIASADEDSIRLIDKVEGNFTVTSGAVGMLNNDTATITVDVTGIPNTVVLSWSGRGPDPDDTITININGGPDLSVTADLVEEYTARCCNSDNYSYYAELPLQFFASGVNTVQISDLSIAESHGADLTVVSSSLALPRTQVARYWGLDGFHVRHDGLFGPNSQVVCHEFDAVQKDRNMNVFMTVGGVQHEFRPNHIWYQVGSGALPTGEIVGAGTVIPTSNDLSGNPYPLYGSQNQNGGAEMDLFRESIHIPDGSEWACFQVESFSENSLLGVSALWSGLATELELPEDPSAITLSMTSANSNELLVSPILAPVATLLLFSLLMLTVRFRAQRS